MLTGPPEILSGGLGPNLASRGLHQEIQICKSGVSPGEPVIFPKFPGDSSTPAIIDRWPQEVLKHATPDCLVRGTDLSSLRLSKKNMTTANTTVAVQWE